MKIETSKLKTALDYVRPIINRRMVLPILSCVKLHTERNRLHITATNLDEYIVERVEVDGEIEPVCISFNYFCAALSGETTEIKSSKGVIIIKCGENETSLSTMDAGEFPAIPKFEKGENHGVACADLSDAINQVAWAASVDESRYVLMSVLIHSSAKNLAIVATNGRELAIVNVPLIGSEFEIVFPSSFVSSFCASLARMGAVLSSNEKQVRVSHDWGNYFCKQVEGAYPNYKGVIPAKTKPLGTVSVEEFLGMVSNCAAFSEHPEAKGLFRFSKKELSVEFVGDNNATLSRHMAGSFAEFGVALSTKKLARIFSQLKTDEAKLFFVDELLPITIESGNLKVFTAPMRM
jgi:DNA polymerase III subunit beta